MGLFSELEAQLTVNASDFSSDLSDAASDASNFASETSSSFAIVGESADEMGDEVSDVLSAFDRLDEAAGESIVPIVLLGESLDETADEASDAGSSSYFASSGFASMSLSASGASFAVGLLSTSLGAAAFAATALVTALTPLMFILGTLALGFAGIAAAMGAIIGTGLLAFGSKLAKQNKQQLKQVNKQIRALEKLKEKNGQLTKAQRKRLKQLEKKQDKLKEATKATGALALKFQKLKKELAPILIQFGSKFIPLIKDAINALPQLVQSIIDAIGPLNKFKQALRRLGQLAMKYLPRLIGFIIDIGRWALPIFMSIATFVIKNVVPALKKFVAIGKDLWRRLKQIAPSLKQVKKFAKRVWKFTNRLIESFKGAKKKGSKLHKELKGLWKAMGKFWEKLKPVLKDLKPLIREVGQLAGFVTRLAIDIATLVFQIGAKLLPLLRPVINLVTRIVKWFNNLAPPIKKAILLAGGLYVALGPLISIFWTVVGVLGAVVSAIGLVPIAIAGLILAIVLLADYVYKNWNQIVSWTKDLVNDVVSWFSKMGTKIWNTVTGFIGDVVHWLQNDAVSDMISAATAVGNAIASGLVAGFNAILPDTLGLPSITIPGVSFKVPGLTIAGHTIYEGTTVGVGPFGPFGGQSVPIPQLDTGGFIESDGLAMLHEGERVLNTAEVDRLNNGKAHGRTEPTEIIVTLDTDDEALEEWVSEQATVVVKNTVESTFEQAERRGVFR